MNPIIEKEIEATVHFDKAQWKLDELNDLLKAIKDETGKHKITPQILKEIETLQKEANREYNAGRRASKTITRKALAYRINDAKKFIERTKKAIETGAQ